MCCKTCGSFYDPAYLSANAVDFQNRLRSKKLEKRAIDGGDDNGNDDIEDDGDHVMPEPNDKYLEDVLGEAESNKDKSDKLKSAIEQKKAFIGMLVQDGDISPDIIKKHENILEQLQRNLAKYDVTKVQGQVSDPLTAAAFKKKNGGS